MNNNKIKLIVLPLVVISFFVLVCYNMSQQSLNYSSPKVSQPEFSSEENDYIATHSSLTVYVDPELQYLVDEGNEGYINSYVSSIFDVADLEAIIETDASAKDECDMILETVTESVRNGSESILYSLPIMQVEGSLFVREGAGDDDSSKGVIVSDRLRLQELEDIRYNMHTFEKKTVASNKAAVELAVKDNSDIDYIVGDTQAISYYLGNNKMFMPEEKSLYRLNVCFVFNDKQSVMHSVINTCVNCVDRRSMSYEKSVQWANGNAPVFERTRYNNVYVIALIIMLAVVIAFMIYYVSNKNMYDELEIRMAKLNASRKELQTTFNGINFFLAELTLSGDIIDINRAFYEYLSYSPVGKKIWDVIHLDSKTNDIIRRMISAAGNSQVLEGFEIEANRRIFLVEIFPVEGADGKIDKLLFMGSDVTKEKMAEKQMVQDNKMIAVGQLASGVAHEIRNPLGIIRNYCYVLKTMNDESIRKTAIENIEHAVETSGEIIENLLNFSRASSKKIDSINVQEHITSMLKLNESLIKKKDITVDLECADDINVKLIVESFDMILINLISNAIDAMEKQGKIKITVRENKHFGLFRVDVEDNGSGIDPDTLNEIFNPFFTTKIDSGGTGLGLYIVYNEIEKMNGTISVDSKVGEGTIFKIVLPVNVGNIEGN